MLALFALHPVFACPTIATGTPTELSFDVAQVAIVRQGTRTTFSVSINPVGPSQQFALVLPVPEVLAEDEIRTLDGKTFARLDAYTAPRHVDDAGCNNGTTSASSPAAGGGYDGADTGADTIVVEAEYLVGEYQIVILSAEESGNLQIWLDANGYQLPPNAEPMLAEYIDAGSYFLAAKVAKEAALADGTPLSPLQISYNNEIFAIPIRLATLNSPGEQDMVIYAVTPLEGSSDNARVGISNYTEAELLDTCIWGDPSTEDFAEFYAGELTAALDALDDAGWVQEFAGAANDCNPCTGVSITAEDIAELGFDGELEDHHLTRLRMRYTPDQATQDLNLYASGIYEPDVTVFADDNSWNRTCVSVCGEEGTIPGSTGGETGGETGGGDTSGGTDGGTGGAGSGGSSADGGGADPDAASDGGCGGSDGEGGCASAPGGGAAALGFGLLGLLWRRRR